MTKTTYRRKTFLTLIVSEGLRSGPSQLEHNQSERPGTRVVAESLHFEIHLAGKERLLRNNILKK